MDKPSMSQTAAERFMAGERAIDRAFADAALALFGAGRPAEGPGAATPPGALRLVDIRRALADARWRAEPDPAA